MEAPPHTPRPLSLQSQQSIEVDEPPLDVLPTLTSSVSQIPTHSNSIYQNQGPRSPDTDLTTDCFPTQAVYRTIHGAHNRIPQFESRVDEPVLLQNGRLEHIQQQARSIEHISQQATESENNVPIDEIPPTYNPLRNPLRIEKNRLATFRTWPKNDVVFASDLARDGFFYMKKDDYAQCVFCQGILSGWTRGNAVVIEHRRIFPQCPYVRGEQVGNIPISPDHNVIAYPAPLRPPQQRERTAEGEEFSSGIPNTVNQSASPSTGVVSQRPLYPQYAVASVRKQTYTSWPTQIKQTPEQLVKAGFYYMGQGDRVKCFYCGGVLYDWEPEDDPWVEHAKWFKDCPHVKLCKGEAFMKFVHDQQVGLPVSENDNSPEQASAFKYEQMEQAISEIESSANSQENESEVNCPISMETESNTGDHATSQNTGKPMTSKDAKNEGKTGEGSDRLTEDVKSIIKENQDLKDERLCKICMEEEIGVTFVPCGHLVCCASCASAVSECPMCRQQIEGVVKTYWT
ncbi:hypothetical protein ScPMuIL_012402 [Solemya velum]